MKTGDMLNNVITNKLGTKEYAISFSINEALAITDAYGHDVSHAFETWESFIDWLNE